MKKWIILAAAAISLSVLAKDFYENVNVKGNLAVTGTTNGGTQFNLENLRLDLNTISSTDTNGDINLDPNGTGGVVLTDLTASTVPYLDSSKKLTSSAVTPTQMTYLANASANLCGISQSCTLTNKSIDADSNTITNIDNGEIKAAAAIAVNKLAALTASRVVITDGSGFISAADTATYPNLTELSYVKGVTSSLCGISQSCTETNKTFTSPAINGSNLNFGTASNTNRLYLPTETTTNLDALTDTAGLVAYDTTLNKVVYNNGTSWTAVGSGGGGGTNQQTEFISNGKFEDDTVGATPSGWATYADAAATSPVDCTGGSPNITFLATSTSGEVQRGSKSGELVKGAANRQGEGISYDFTIDPKDYGTLSPVYLSADYNNTSGYASSDVKVFVYDKDAATLLTVQDVSGLSGALPSSTGGTKWTGVFYPTSTTSNDYRLCFHISSTSATAYDFHLDSVHVGGLDQIPGAIKSYLGSFTPTGSWSTNTTYTGQAWRDGDHVILKIKIALAGAPTSANLSVNYPSEYPIDTSKLSSTTSAGSFINEGHSMAWDNGVNSYPLDIRYETSNMGIMIANVGSTYPTAGYVTQAVPFTFGNTDEVNLIIRYPVVNWQASAALSASEILYSTCKVVAESTAATSFSDATETDVPYATETEDNCSAYDGTTFIAPKTAKYLFNVRVAIDGMSANCSHLQYLNLTNASNTQQALINAGGICYASYYGAGSAVLRLTKGDQIKVRAYQGNGATRTRSTSASENRLEITEQPDFSVFSQFNTVDRQYSMTCSGPSGWSTVNCKGLPYLTADGAWRLKFNISGTKTSGNNAQISITGVTFKNGYRQSVSCNDDSGGSAPANCFAESNTAYIQLSFASSQTSVTASGDVELNSKPTFVP